MSDDRLRKAYQARTAAASSAARPTPEELARLVAGEGSETERLALLDRVLADPVSAREFELLRAIHQAASSTRAQPRWRRAAPLALAASVLVAVVGVVTLRNRPADVTRAPHADGAPVQLSPAADERVAGAISFLWNAVPGARGYRLELLTDAGSVATTLATSDTSASYTPTGAAGAPGAYRWVVVALFPEGREVPSRARRLVLVTP